MSRIRHKSHKCVIPGACPGRWRSTREETAQQRRKRYAKLVLDGYRAIYEQLGCRVNSKGAAKFGQADNVTLIALKRIAEKLYHDALRASEITDARTQKSNENLAARLEEQNRRVLV